MPKTNGKPNDPLHVAFVLDRSGSMSHLRDAVVSGVQEFVSELRRNPGNTRFSLTAFDTHRAPAPAVPLAEVPSTAETVYEPGGMTALYDAVAHSTSRPGHKRVRGVRLQSDTARRDRARRARRHRATQPAVRATQRRLTAVSSDTGLLVSAVVLRDRRSLACESAARHVVQPNERIASRDQARSWGCNWPCYGR